MRSVLATRPHMRRYSVSGVFRDAANFARGVLIGGFVALFVWLIVD